MRRTRVMIVEDSAVVREMLRLIVASGSPAGVCATAGSGEEALKILEDASPDVISLEHSVAGNGWI